MAKPRSEKPVDQRTVLMETIIDMLADIRDSDDPRNRLDLKVLKKIITADAMERIIGLKKLYPHPLEDATPAELVRLRSTVAQQLNAAASRTSVNLRIPRCRELARKG